MEGIQRSLEDDALSCNAGVRLQGLDIEDKGTSNPYHMRPRSLGLFF